MKNGLYTISTKVLLHNGYAPCLPRTPATPTVQAARTKVAFHIVSTKVLLRNLKQWDRNPEIYAVSKPELFLGAQQKAILDIIGKGRIVSRVDILNKLWSFDVNGGPPWALSALRVQILRLREKGYPIRAHGKSWYSLGI